MRNKRRRSRIQGLQNRIKKRQRERIERTFNTQKEDDVEEGTDK